MNSFSRPFRFTPLVFRTWPALLLGLVAFGCEQEYRDPLPAPPSTLPAVIPQITSTDEANNVAIFKSAHRSTVNITNNRRRRDWLTLNVFEIPRGSGSGFIWSEQGYIVTNAHVIEGASSVVVGLYDQSSWPATLVGIARSKDIAVLKIEAPAELLKPLPVGDSEGLEVGRKVLAIGNPFGLDSTLTTGIVSALGREIDAPNGRTIQGVIQTDAAINPGNSGGPLLDSLGRLVGMNTAIIGPGGGSAGIGFAVPVNIIRKVVPQLIQYGRIIRPVLGIAIIDDQVAARFGVRGVIVQSVQRGGGADAAGMIGLRRDFEGRIALGDVIVAIDGESVDDSNDFLNILESYRSGDVVSVKTVRQNKQRTIRVKLGEAN